MWDKIKEWFKIDYGDSPLKGCFSAILVGLGASVAMFIYALIFGVCGECFGAGCSKNSTFLNVSAVLVFGPLVAGILVGIVYWFTKQMQDADEKRRERIEKHRKAEQEAEERRKEQIERHRKAEEERRKAEAEKNRKEQEQRRRYASEFQDIRVEMLAECVRNAETTGMYEQNPVYEAADLQRDVWNAVDKAFVQLQKLGDVVDELKAAGGK